MNLISKILLLPYNIREYDTYQALRQTESRLIKLKDRIMDGDNKAASLALEQLEQYDTLKIEFENKNLNQKR